MKITSLYTEASAWMTKCLRAVRTTSRSARFAAAGLIALLGSTAYWAFLSAGVNLHNADQLVGQFLFEHSPTLHGAVIPSAHSFILKWPVFFLIREIGINATTITAATVVLTLATVSIFACILYRIVRRPALFGMLCLILALVLLMVPAEPYPGALLPVNMAMLSTRNIEYVLYVIALILIIKAPRFRHGKLLAACLILAGLVASDKLFLALTLGGASLMAVHALLRRQSAVFRTAIAWLAAGLIAGLLGTLILWALNKVGFVIIHSSGQGVPYTLVSGPKDIVIGGVYAVLGVATNLGINPAFDATIIRNIPAQALHRLLSIEGIVYVFNGVIIVGGITAALRYVFRRSDADGRMHSDAPRLLSQALVWSTVTALILFVATDHYYPVDARYLGIATFAGFVVLAAWLRAVSVPPLARITTYAYPLLLVVVLSAAVTGAWRQANDSQSFYRQTAGYDAAITAALTQHATDTLIGDYWRVMPIKLHDPSQNVYPLAGCITPRDVLLSKAWQPDTAHESFAYLLLLKPSNTGFPACTIDQVVAQYGRPSSSQIIAGDAAKPEEIILFYDYGINVTVPPSPKAPSSAILPRSVDELSAFTCPGTRTVMNIVAHQDDDILFINPETYRVLKEGGCVRSTYVTAGDAGTDMFYWLGREEGSKAAYATMLGIAKPTWISRTVSLSDKSYVTIAKLKDNPHVMLTFMHLPDGSPSGNGFAATHNESLANLAHGRIAAIHTVDGQSTYTSQELVAALTTLMIAFQPDEINTQAAINHSKKYPDHSDHLMTGWYGDQAFSNYQQQRPAATISHYLGYPERDHPVNVSGDDLAVTNAAFFAYAKHDRGTCESVAACSKMSYGYYLSRQYRE